MSDDPSKNKPPRSVKHSSIRDNNDIINENIIDNDLFIPYDSFGEQKQSSQHRRRESGLEDISTANDFHLRRYNSNNDNSNKSPSIQPIDSPFRTPDRYSLRDHAAIGNIEPEPFRLFSQQHRQYRHDEEGVLTPPTRNDNYERQPSISHQHTSFPLEDAAWQSLESSPGFRSRPYPLYERGPSSSEVFSSNSPSASVEFHKRRRESPPSPISSRYSHSQSSLSPYLDIPATSSWRRRQQEQQLQEQEKQRRRHTPPQDNSSSQAYYDYSRHNLNDSPTSHLTSTRRSLPPPEGTPEGMDIRDRPSSEPKYSRLSTVRSSSSASSVQDRMEFSERHGSYSHGVPPPHMYHPHYSPISPYLPYGSPYGYHPHHPSNYHYFHHHPTYAAHSSNFDPMMQMARRKYIENVNDNDVLCGRGGATNSHIGNRSFRIIVKQHQSRYLRAKKKEKPEVAAHVVSLIRKLDPPGRFLKKDKDKGLWFDIGDERAKEKTSQALREGAPEIRKRKNTNSFDIEDTKLHGENASISSGCDNEVIIKISDPKKQESPSILVSTLSSVTSNDIKMKRQSPLISSPSVTINEEIKYEHPNTPLQGKNSSKEIMKIASRKSPTPPSSSKDEDDNDDIHNKKLPTTSKPSSEKDSSTGGRESNHSSPLILQDISFSGDSDYNTFSPGSGSSEEESQKRLRRRRRNRTKYSKDIVIQPALPNTRNDLQKLVLGNLSNEDKSLYTTFFDPPHDTALKSRSNSSNEDQNSK